MTAPPRRMRMIAVYRFWPALFFQVCIVAMSGATGEVTGKIMVSWRDLSGNGIQLNDPKRHDMTPVMGCRNGQWKGIYG